MPVLLLFLRNIFVIYSILFLLSLLKRCSFIDFCPLLNFYFFFLVMRSQFLFFSLACNVVYFSWLFLRFFSLSFEYVMPRICGLIYFIILENCQLLSLPNNSLPHLLSLPPIIHMLNGLISLNKYYIPQSI